MYILSFYGGHDSSVCLMKDGKVLTHLEIERITRVKGHHGIDINDLKKNKGKPWEKKGIVYFIELVFNRFNISWQDISYVAVTPDFDDKKYIPDKVSIIKVNHHDAHAASAFYLSPFKKALILTVDGGGNDGGGLFGYGERNKIFVKRKTFSGVFGKTWYKSRQYWSNTKHGPIGTEGVLMGAAPYGEINNKLKNFIYQQLTIEQPLRYRIIKNFLEGESRKKLNLVPDNFNSKEEKNYFSYCASLQKATEMVFEDYFEELLSYENCKNVCLAGGTLLNCVAIGKILKKYPDLKLYFCPAVNDSGITIGACLWTYYMVLENKRIINELYQTPYLGFKRENYNYEELFKRYENIKVNKNISITNLTDLLIRGKIISLYNGSSESGKRALGNRSIVCDPRKKEIKKQINQKVKHRHWYRPFAPSVLREKVSDVFKMDAESPYMSIALPIKKKWKNKIPAVAHVDGTSRLQTVTKELNPFYYNLIKNFYRKTGVPMVLNTSFNDNEPIVETPEDALKCFLKTEIDYLYIEGYLVSKKN